MHSFWGLGTRLEEESWGTGSSFYVSSAGRACPPRVLQRLHGRWTRLLSSSRDGLVPHRRVHQAAGTSGGGGQQGSAPLCAGGVEGKELGTRAILWGTRCRCVRVTGSCRPRVWVHLLTPFLPYLGPPSARSRHSRRNPWSGARGAA